VDRIATSMAAMGPGAVALRSSRGRHAAAVTTSWSERQRSPRRAVAADSRQSLGWRRVSSEREGSRWVKGG
jgi:hypothetical protein